MNEKNNLRKDIVSRKMFHKNELFRLTKQNEMIIIDNDYNQLGRGLYLKKDVSTINEAEKHNLIAKVMRCHVEQKFYQQLKDCLNDN